MGGLAGCSGGRREQFDVMGVNRGSGCNIGVTCSESRGRRLRPALLTCGIAEFNSSGDRGRGDRGQTMHVGADLEGQLDDEQKRLLNTKSKKAATKMYHTNTRARLKR